MTMLPMEFADLEPFAVTWCLVKETDRWNQRMASTQTQLQELYDAVNPRLAAAVDFVDQFPLDDMPLDALNLMYLIYSLITTSFAVECWGQPKIPDTGAAYLENTASPIP